MTSDAKNITFKNDVVADIAKNQSIIITYGSIRICDNVMVLLTLFYGIEMQISIKSIIKPTSWKRWFIKIN